MSHHLKKSIKIGNLIEAIVDYFGTKARRKKASRQNTKNHNHVGVPVEKV